MTVHSNTEWVLRIPGVTNPAESPLVVTHPVASLLALTHLMDYQGETQHGADLSQNPPEGGSPTGGTPSGHPPVNRGQS